MEEKTMNEVKVYQEVARLIGAYQQCIKTGNSEWAHLERIEAHIKDLPHGSGIDGTTYLDFEKSSENKLVIHSEYHCMNDNGMYDGWVNFTITITPSLSFGFYLKITGNFGKYREVVLDYLVDTFTQAFNETIKTVA
jgi:hypothetical protein